MSRNKIIPYNPKLKEHARQLRKNSTLAEVLLWQKIQKKAFGVQFHRQVPLLNYIVDFYCHELKLAIEIDGDSHEFKYNYDEKRQGELEKKGVSFLRFSDSEVKNNIFSVTLAIEETVSELLINTPKVPSRGQSMSSTIENRNELKKGVANERLLHSPPKKGIHQFDSRGDFKFPKQQRLKSKKVIERLFAEGKSINAYPLKLIYLKTPLPEEVSIQVTVIAPKKHFKSAVKRNRIKRLMREAYRLNRPAIFNNMEAQYALVILYLGKEMPSFSKIEMGLKMLLTKFKKQISDEKADA